jgi:transposase
MSAGLTRHSKRKSTGSPSAGTLFLALELSHETWKLAFATGRGPSARRRDVAARDILALLREIRASKRKLGLTAEARVVSCYEAGRDGFWLARCLTEHGVENLVIDSSSIEVNRRGRRAKSDSLDVEKLLSLLLRHASGEPRVFSIAQVPTPEEEDARQLHRELQTLKQETTRHVNRIKGLLASLGLALEIDQQFQKRLKEARQWNGQPVPEGMRQRLLHEFERLQVANRQIRELCRARSRTIQHASSPQVKQVQKLLGLRAIGVNGAWLLVQEFFGWRKFANRKQLGSLAGLTPTPYSSGQSDREQGISKAGNRRIRWMMVELAWSWLRFQPESELSRWYLRRFARGSSRQRRMGIVALARKLLVQLWKYLQTGLPPTDATLADWKTKTRGTVNRLEAA